MKKITNIILILLFASSCSTTQQAYNFANTLDSKSDMQLCIDIALAGAYNEQYFDLINVEIEKRGVDCSQYKEQVETARSSQQVMGTLTGFMAILFGLLYGLSSA
tara:strand:+ start:146 stop:460 length:315 start_codon:yes stop_codon:yes gene_type:complete